VLCVTRREMTRGKNFHVAAAFVVATALVLLCGRADALKLQQPAAQIERVQKTAGLADVIDRIALAPEDDPNNCCYRLKNIPWMEPDEAYDAKALHGGCTGLDRTCMYKACCNSKTHQACKACCEVKALAGWGSPGCLDFCQRCFTCEFPEPETPEVFAPHKESLNTCAAGRCGRKRKCIPSRDGDYCRCVNRSAVNPYEVPLL